MDSTRTLIMLVGRRVLTLLHLDLLEHSILTKHVAKTMVISSLTFSLQMNNKYQLRYRNGRLLEPESHDIEYGMRAMAWLTCSYEA